MWEGYRYGKDVGEGCVGMGSAFEPSKEFVARIFVQLGR